LAKIDGLESTIKANDDAHEKECKRLNTEIERLNNILKATNHNLDEQVAKLTE